eukprot:gb/GECG01000164.1/.p1 GENE.gb/GECG01000164.1/~~gb/GECG01000164.1/.p1  ORF type:complete len:683 (+),score=64.76 gb/GECG01000164.1/:1-2049(+)
MKNTPIGWVALCLLGTTLGSVFRAASAAGSAFGNSSAACDPLDPSLCMFPFPNNFWRNENGTVEFDLYTFPTTNEGKPISPSAGGWNTLDGFSPIPPILTYFPGLSLTGCPRLWNVDFSLSSDSATLLINADTNEIVPHWVELDHLSDVDHSGEYPRAMIMWPSARLQSGARYIVAMRNLQHVNGSSVKSSAAFQSIVSGQPSGSVPASRIQYFNDHIFPTIKNQGVSKNELQLAWDFTVGTQKEVTKRFVSMRDDAFARMPSSGPTYNVTSVQNHYKPGIGKFIEGTVDVPWYLNSVYPGLDVHLVEDSTGLPIYQQTVPVEFSVLVPESLTNGSITKAARIIQYGHGLFGSQREILTDYLIDEANEHGYVYVAVNWKGLCNEDVLTVGMMLLTNMTDFRIVPDRLHQGMLDALYSMRMMLTSFKDDPSMQVNGQSIIRDSSKRNYYGNSCGGIYGTVYMAVSQDVTEGVIGVGGSPFALLLPRSVDFDAMRDIIFLSYSGTLERPALLAVVQLLWDRMEPSGYLHAISRDPLPNTPPHRIVQHYGLGDAQVTWLGDQTIGRSINASMFESNVAEGNVSLFGFPFVSDSNTVTKGHVIQGFDFGVPVVPFTDVPPPRKYDTHENTRRVKAGQQQMYQFFETGKVENYCNGACHYPYNAAKEFSGGRIRPSIRGSRQTAESR